MKPLTFLIFILLILNTAEAVNPYIIKSNGMEPVCDSSNIVLPNLPPVMDQGNYGMCYAHSSLILLEHLRCGKVRNPSSCYANRGSVLHLSGFDSYNKKEINIGGDPTHLLSNFKMEGRKLSLESCAPYEQWKELNLRYTETRSKFALPNGESKDENDYFYYISRMLRSDSSQKAKECYAREILSNNTNQNIADIISVLDKAGEITWKQLRYRVLVPESCEKSMIDYPDYQIISYPNYRDSRTFKGFRDQVFRSLSAGHPVEASFLASIDDKGKRGLHSATIVGQRHVCNKYDCRLQFRIQNSAGERWQNAYDNGWVNAENFSSLMNEDGLGLMTLVPKGQTLGNSEESPFYTSSPLNENARQIVKNNEKCWTVDAKAVDNRPSSGAGVPLSKPKIYPHPGQSSSGMYKCENEEGAISFTDDPRPELNCQPYSFD